MPVMPGYKYARESHELVKAPPGYQYGCNSERSGDTSPRGASIEYRTQDGWTDDGRREMRRFVTDWLDNGCGHILSHKDEACRGCVHRQDQG